MLAPGLGGGAMDAIDEGLGRVPVGCFEPGGGLCRVDWLVGAGGEEGGPGGFNDPVDGPGWVLLAERGDGRQGVEDVSHGAETDDKEAVAGLGVQVSIFA